MIYLDYAATTPICEEALTVYQKLASSMPYWSAACQPCQP